MAGSYTLPQTRVFQEFSMAPNDVTQNLNPFVMGPRFEAFNYHDATKRSLCTNLDYLGKSLTLPWSPNMPQGSTPDATAGKYGVTFENAYVELADATSGTAAEADIGDDGKARKFTFESLSTDVTDGHFLGYTETDGGDLKFAKIIARDGLTVTLDTYVPAVGLDEQPKAVTFAPALFIETVEAQAKNLTANQSGGVTVAAAAKILDGAVEREVLAAKAYLNQRSLRTDSAFTIGSVENDADIVRTCGPIVPSNPLAYALHLTLRNCASATVRYMAIKADTKDGWIEALKHATNTNEVYAICPATETTGATRRGIYALVEEHCDAMSQPEEKSWRIAFVNSIPERGEDEDAADWAKSIATESKRLANHRVYNVFPGTLVDIDGNTVDGMYAAAAVCGLACSVLPQQPITNVELEGFYDVPDAYSTFSRAELNTIAAGGTLIVMQDRPGSVVYIRHQISTAYSKGEGVAKAELSMVRNLDSISYYFANRFAPYIGRYNVTDDLLTEIKCVIKDGLAFLQTATEGNRLIGPQVLADGTELRNIYIVGGEKDHVAAEVALNLPAPFNNFDLHLQVI